MISSRKVLAVAGAVVAATVIAACGSSSSGGTATTTPSSGTTATGTPVKVGIVCSCSGPFGGTIASALTVAQDWAKSVNAAGGVNGHPVVIDSKDDASVVATSVTDAASLFSSSDVVLDLTILDGAWIKQADAAKVPIVGGNFSSPQYYTDPNWYPSGQTNDSIVYSVVATAKQAGATKLGQLYCAESPQCAQSVKPVQAAGKQLGVPVVYNASIAYNAPNYTAQCLAAKQAGVDALFIGDSTAVIARVATDCDKQGYDPIYITEGTGFQDQVLTTPGLKDKLWSPFPILPYYSTEPAVTQMNATLDKYSPGLRQDATTWSEYAAQAWTGGLLIEQAIKASGLAAGDAVTPAAIQTGLDKTTKNTLGGFSPPLTFVAGKPNPVDCWFTGRVQGGKASQVGGLTCQNS
jgi:branched-chain amino acid transport system substrate-binding protein